MLEYSYEMFRHRHAEQLEKSRRNQRAKELQTEQETEAFIRGKRKRKRGR